ncbi:hypothetical protein CLV58_14114 [Spirosoma oryzae]|uniref:Uncharacterized protein n=1 Tax=Spirosoma oryzae TaxID=1469603 RepID=A0A2T0RQX5_9BACT|nr:hypothetical protein [Spirosoma oryzae]PRY23493.1 hypothetical protein CLV58_14114 [Spirosoma oryzae]
MSRQDYSTADSFINSLRSHRHPSRDSELSVDAIDAYVNAIAEFSSWLYGQIDLPLAKAFNDSYHIPTYDTWWKLITPQALIILSTYQRTGHTIHVFPLEQDEDRYQFQLDQVDTNDEIALDAYRKYLDEYVGYFKL